MAHVAGLLASAVVSAVGNKLGSAIGDEVTMLWNFKDDLKDLKDTLQYMEAALKDAERRSVSEELVRLWLNQLKNAAYDISYMLDEFQANSEPASRKMIGKLDCFAIAPNITMAYKMKKMRGQLRKIKEDHESFKFTHDNSSLISVRQFPDPRETTSYVIESLIIGREKDRMNVLSLLSTSSNKEDITILPICGLGGIGKTTLAQLVFNDAQFKEYDHRVWVYVSQVFDMKKIGNSIISQVEKGSQNLDTRQLINQHLKHLLQDKKTLIVLDDLWETDSSQLNQLKLMLNGSSKMRVLVTTRSIDIARKISTVEPYMLDLLDNDMCWRIIKQNSGYESRADKAQVEPIGQAIAKKCGGLPLAAQALGFLLSGMNLSDWEAMCNSDIWDEPFSDSTVLPSLKLSYNTLTPYLRLCFAYCGIFHKGHNKSKDDLIYQWIALGFIEPSNTFSAIQLGEKYVRQFLGMSFLQHSKLPKSFAKTIFTMHDLVHDLARSVIAEELAVFDAEIASNARRKEYCRYASLTNCNISDYIKARKMSTIFPPKLRAMHFSDCEFHGGAFSFPKCLHVLDLSGCSIKEFPSALGQLKQLEFLIAPELQDRQFPQSITRLSKLHYLNLNGSREISEISSSLGKLGSLAHLDLSNCTSIKVIPETLGSLRNLQTLDLKGCEKLKCLPENLGSLKNLQTLNLSGCDRLKSLPESLGSLENLQKLDLSGCYRLGSSGRDPLPESLGNLKTLQTLDLSACYSLRFLPKSLGSLKNLQTLNIFHCQKLESLPESLGSLKNLQTLDLSRCYELKSLPESLGGLKNLQTLNLFRCAELEYLPESVGSLENLQTLDLSNCWKLGSLPENLESLKNLQTLNLSSCYKLKSLPESLENLTIILRDLR
ncbi:putative disease resistance protein RGA1 [Triticum dicoccoides]|uniref:putative disease resistance protein RGA1 n=1 Tax=Triticum dicoccoides TaxID=85692 RepID=UPI0018912D5C|nr:putative disease resistance protein RGA1 [Triticum dicoccoides]